MARLRLFGHPALDAAGSRKPLGLPPKALAMLAIASANAERPLSREWLAQALWPDCDPPQARANLRRQLHLVLKAVGEDALLLTRETVQWNANGSITADVVAFDRLRKTDPQAAIEEYSGELCAGASDEALDDLRMRYRSRYEHLLHTELERARAAKDDAATRVCLQHLIAYDPFDEDAVREMMRVRIKTADRAGALRDYAAFRQRLLSEIGVEPQPETAALFAEIAAHDTALSVPNNLGAATTSFVGRERELAQVAAALRDARVVTLVGAGGIGKSRLALRCCFDLLNSYSDGIWTVDLEHARSQADIWQSIGDALHLPASDDRKNAVLHFLRHRRSIVLLDTCERAVDAVQNAIHALVDCTSVRVLATSRHRLNVADAHEILVPPLDIPPAEIPEDGTPIRYSAYRLFVERAALASPAFRVPARYVPSLIALLRSIDGMPLAIELVASRANVLTVDGLRRRVAQALRSARTGDPRSRGSTLFATLAWSYDMLSARERKMFKALALFAGTFSPDDVEQLCADIPRALEVLFALADASLVSVIAKGDEVRYRLLETTRVFAGDQLANDGELEKRHLLHAQIFASKADALAQLHQTAFPKAIESLVDAMPDYLAALDNAARYGWPDIGVRLIEGLYRFGMRGHFTVPIRERAQALVENPAIAHHERARVARLAGTLNENPIAVRLFEFAAAYYRECGDEIRLCDALSGLAATQYELGNFDECERLLLYVRERMERGGDRRVFLKALGRLVTLYTIMGAQRYERAVAIVPQLVQELKEMGDVREAAQHVRNLAAGAYFAGRYDDALGWAQQALELTSSTGEVAMRVNLLTLCGAAEQERGDCTSAMKWHRQACELIGQLPECYEAADSLEDMAGTLALLGSFAEAARIAGYCARLRERLAHPINPNERSAYDRMLARLRAGLDGRFAAEFSGYQTDSFAGICRVAGRALEKAGSALKNQDNEDTTSLS